ncbi:FliA/WhiG family RNA polymerase sigma factor [Sporosalibacterium faouarense]|uniref:FliA/WhiG family RNA polymerase sigma factor n=1 Tax=Sporosalibacterium faouarense TaxID=516123 RepID=UPI00192BB1C6|nr:FliA/WhiG family RNA polymerase sigma factor [Sporosalibacterium faouarense]
MTIEEIWQKYKNTSDIFYKQELIEKYVPLVRIVAGRMYNFYGGNVEFDELLGFGIFGLIDAIEKFEVKRDIKFETYAQIRIRGSIIDSLRKLDWVPRSLRKKSKEYEAVISKLENKLFKNVTVDDIANELNVSKEEVQSTLAEISTFNIVSFEELISLKGDYYSANQSQLTPEEKISKEEIKKILKETIDSLPEKEKMIISMYYFDELTYKEIGEVLDLSESRISQIHSKAILKMKGSLNKIGIDDLY